MRRIRYAVAASLDGYIAGPKGEADWIVMDPEIDFSSFFAQFDTLLIGSRTFKAMAEYGSGGMPGMKSYVLSRSLRQEDHPKVTILSENAVEKVQSLKQREGKDIWLFGGGELFRSLVEARQVDTVEIAIVPVLLGGGIPLLPPPSRRVTLRLTGHKIYSTGVVSLEYAVDYTAPAGTGKKKRAKKTHSELPSAT